MTKEDIFEIVKRELKDICKINDDIELENEICADYGFDELDLMELIIAIEEKFDISIIDGKITEESTIGNIVDIIFETINN